MKASQIGRVSDHSKGLGTLTREDVLKRARELAVINGRTPQNVLESDWRAAREELLGHETHLATDEDPIASASVTPWEVPASTGHRTPVDHPSDEQTVAERLTMEGADEAEHDRMVEATKNNRNQ